MCGPSHAPFGFSCRCFKGREAREVRRDLEGARVHAFVCSNQTGRKEELRRGREVRAGSAPLQANGEVNEGNGWEVETH